MATSFTIDLTGDQEAPTPRESDATGTGTATWDAATNTLTYSVTVTGLDFGIAAGLGPQTPETADDVTNAHFHNAAREVSGPVVFGQIGPAQDPDLEIQLEPANVTLNTDESWTLSGNWTPSDPANAPITNFAAALTAASDGQDVPLYYNVHTTTFPAGEIRGQLVAADSGPGPGPEPEPEPEPTPGDVDWNALAAVVQANFAATGKWFPGQTLPPGPVDWNAVAAEVTANFDETGQWFI